jgi:hypothetical protein
MTETKAEMARILRQDSKRNVKEICQTLQISEATFYRYTRGCGRRKMSELISCWGTGIAETRTEDIYG